MVVAKQPQSVIALYLFMFRGRKIYTRHTIKPFTSENGFGSTIRKRITETLTHESYMNQKYRVYFSSWKRKWYFDS